MKRFFQNPPTRFLKIGEIVVLKDTMAVELSGSTHFTPGSQANLVLADFCI